PELVGSDTRPCMLLARRAGGFKNERLLVRAISMAPVFIVYFVFIVVVAFARPSDLAVTVMVPVWPRLALMMARARRLKALRSGKKKMSMSVASPLSVATISPGPVIEK